MEIKKSDIFKKIYRNMTKACISQDVVLNRSLSKFPKERTQEANDLFEIITLFGTYSDITHCIGFAETICDYLKNDNNIIDDVDLFDFTVANSLVQDVNRQQIK